VLQSSAAAIRALIDQFSRGSQDRGSANRG
jgi:hypothetical protein